MSRKKSIKNYIIILFLLIGILFHSCTGFSELEIGEIREVKIKGFENNALLVDVSIPIENPTLYKITVLELDSKIYINNQYLGKISTVDQVTLPSRSDEIYDLTFSIRVANFFGAALTAMKFKPGQKVQLKMEGTLTARSLLLKKKIPINENREVAL